MTYFDTEIGRGEFVGRVVVESSPVAVEYNSIEADRIEFELGSARTSPALASAQPDALPPLEGEFAGAEPVDLGGLVTRNSGGRRLLRMQATSESDEPARVQAIRYTDASRDEWETNFYIRGPIIEYSDVSERLRVTGEGRMFFYDGRTDDDDDANENLNDADGPNEADHAGEEDAVRFTGRGQTLFGWTGSLLLTRREEMEIVDDVFIRHRPGAAADDGGDGGEHRGASGGSGDLDVWCARLVASIDARGDRVDVLRMSGASAGRLRTLELAGSVYIESGRHEIAANRLHYDAETAMALLSGSREAPVSVQRADLPTSFEAERMFWDLMTDTITVENPGAMTIPGG